MKLVSPALHTKAPYTQVLEAEAECKLPQEPEL